MTEVDKLDRGAESHAVEGRAESRQGEVRSAAVGEDDRIVRILQDLEPLYPRRRRIATGVPPLAVVSQEALARQRGLRSDVDTSREVAEIAIVGNFVQIESAQEGTIAVVGVNQTHRRTATIRGTVLRAHLGVAFDAGLLRPTA